MNKLTLDATPIHDAVALRLQTEHQFLTVLITPDQARDLAARLINSADQVEHPREQIVNVMSHNRQVGQFQFVAPPPIALEIPQVQQGFLPPPDLPISSEGGS